MFHVGMISYPRIKGVVKMAGFFEMAPVVGRNANGEMFVISIEDVKCWINSLASFVGGEEQPFVQYWTDGKGGNVEVGYFDEECANWQTLCLGEADFWLPEVFLQAFCKRFAEITGCAYSE